jgi:hypothetical protein
MQTIIEAFHIIPLLLIVILLAAPYLWKLVRKQNLIIKQLDPLLLMLSAIGTAAGANAHGTELVHHLFDPCFGYAAIITCVAAKMLGFFQKRITVEA